MISTRVLLRTSISMLAIGFLCINAIGQQPSPGVTVGKSYYERQLPIAERNNLYCAGFVQNSPINTSMQIVGGHEEQDQYIYSQNDYIYINAGAAGRLNVGDVLSVVRPRGQASTKWTKKSNLGIYVQEVGAVEIVRVRPMYSVARIKTSCDNFLLGDLVQPTPQRTSPLFNDRPAMDRFGEPSGKAIGRIFQARDNLEMVTRNNIVYVDLGAEDNVKVGDYLTVFRPLGTGNIMMPNDAATVQNSSNGYESRQYRGGRFSNQAPRRSGVNADGNSVSQKDAKSDRPSSIRKVVGELVVLNVKERTATAVVVRTGQEIHTGDFVEVQ